MGVSRLKSIILTDFDRLAAPRISEYLMLDPMLTIQATELHFKDQRDHFQWRRMFCNLPEWAHRLDVFPVDRVTLERAQGDDRSEGVPDVFCIVFYGASKEVRVFPTRTLPHYQLLVLDRHVSADGARINGDLRRHFGWVVACDSIMAWRPVWWYFAFGGLHDPFIAKSKQLRKAMAMDHGIVATTADNAAMPLGELDEQLAREFEGDAPAAPALQQRPS